MTQFEILSAQQDEMIKKLLQLEERNATLLSALMAEIANLQVNNRVNTRRAGVQFDNMPHITVSTYWANISAQVYRQFEGHEAFKYVKFSTTNFKGVIAMTFLKKSVAHYACPLNKGSNPTTWQINSIETINAAFGGVAYGKPNKFYNVEAHPTVPNTVLVWPSTLEFAIGNHVVEINKPIRWAVDYNGRPVMSITKARARFSASFMKLISYKLYECPFVTIDHVDGDIVLNFSETQTPECYEMTPYNAGGSTTRYEICSNRFLEAIGCKGRTVVFDAVSNGTHSVIIKERSEEDAGE